MDIVNLPLESDRFVLYFNTDRHQINAYALATSLIGLSEAVREASLLVNPGYSVEVVVEALEDGSFKASIKTVLEKTRDVFSDAPKQVMYSIIAGYILMKLVEPSEPKIIVNDDSVVVEYGQRTYIIPREVHDAVKLAEKSQRFEQGMGQLFRGADSDPAISGIRLDTSKFPGPGPSIPRHFFTMFDARVINEEGDRVIVEYANLEISRAILARGKRKWEFYWRGVRISAPVTDEQFYDRFFAHDVTIAPGDGLRAAIRITQYQDPDSGIYMNRKYEIIEVLEHIPRMRQTSF
jgi:hypothetical protein